MPSRKRAGGVRAAARTSCSSGLSRWHQEWPCGGRTRGRRRWGGREPFVVAGRLERGDRPAHVLEHRVRIGLRQAPELEVARDHEPGAVLVVGGARLPRLRRVSARRPRARRSMRASLRTGRARGVPARRRAQRDGPARVRTRRRVAPRMRAAGCTGVARHLRRAETARAPADPPRPVRGGRTRGGSRSARSASTSPTRSVGDDGGDLPGAAPLAGVSDAGVGLVAGGARRKPQASSPKMSGASGSTKSPRASGQRGAHVDVDERLQRTPSGRSVRAAAQPGRRGARPRAAGRAAPRAARIESGTVVSPPSSADASICSRKSGFPAAPARIAERLSSSSSVSAARPSNTRAWSGWARRGGSTTRSVGHLPTPDGFRGSGRARPSSRIGARASSATCSTRSRNAGAAQCKSSSTTTSGRSGKCLEQPAGRPGRLLDGLVAGASPAAAAILAATSSPSRSPARTPVAHDPMVPPARPERASRSGAYVEAWPCAGVRPTRTWRLRIGGRPLPGPGASCRHRRAEHRHEARSVVTGCAAEGGDDLGLVLAPDEWRLEAADDGFGVVQHTPNDVVAVSPLSCACVTDEAPRSLADEHVGLAGGGAQPIGLLERRAWTRAAGRGPDRR